MDYQHNCNCEVYRPYKRILDISKTLTNSGKPPLSSDKQNANAFVGTTDCFIQITPTCYTDLPDAESVGQDSIHSVRLHLSPLQFEAVDSRPVLPQSAVGVVVKLWRVGFPWGDSGVRGHTELETGPGYLFHTWIEMLSPCLSVCDTWCYDGSFLYLWKLKCEAADYSLLCVCVVMLGMVKPPTKTRLLANLAKLWLFSVDLAVSVIHMTTL